MQHELGPQSLAHGAQHGRLSLSVAPGLRSTRFVDPVASNAPQEYLQCLVEVEMFHFFKSETYAPRLTEPFLRSTMTEKACILHRNCFLSNHYTQPRPYALP